MTTLTIENTEIPTGIWSIDKTHSEVGFTVKHAGISKVRGKFTDFDASIHAKDDLSDFAVAAVVETASFDSGSPDRDAHVKSADFFDVEQFPHITFDSTKLTHENGKLQMHGNLTIKTTTLPVIFDVELNGIATDPFGNVRAGAEAKTVISRKDFGITWNAVMETGGLLVSDKVTITLDLSFIHS